MKKFFAALILLLVFIFGGVNVVDAATTVKRGVTPTTVQQETATQSATLSAVLETITPTDMPRQDLTKETQTTVEPLKKLLDDQKLGSVFPNNFIKYAIRGAVDAGVPPNTIVLLLLLPGVAALIAGARHLVGLRGFGIFLPAALSVVFVATGPFVGIGLFLVIVFVSTVTRMVLRRFKVKLQYLPRMALLLHFVVLGILGLLFLAPVIGSSSFASVSIFPVLILVLLAEDFSKVQLGKSAKVAVHLTTETLILSLISYMFLNLKFFQELALLKPELWIISIALFDFLMGKYVGLRFLEYWRFRKLIKS